MISLSTLREVELMKQLFGLELFDIGALQTGAFKLKLHEKHPDAPLSPIYVNLRNSSNPTNAGPLTDFHYRLAALMMLSKVNHNHLQFNAICGLPNAGEPFVDAMVELLNALGHRDIVRVVLEKQIDADGSRKIVGLADDQFASAVAGLRVLLVDDLITHADTKVEGIEVLRSVDCIVEDLVVLVDRCQGGGMALHSATGVMTHPVFELTNLLDRLVSIGRLSSSKHHEIFDYLDDN